MSLRGIINFVLLAAFVYAAYCGYQYLQLRNAVLEEIKGKPGVRKMIGDVEGVQINLSQYPSISCPENKTVGWKEFVFKHHSKGCFRFSFGVQSETLKTIKISTDYDTNKLIGERFSYVMVCQKPGEIAAKDNGMPRDYINCE